MLGHPLPASGRVTGETTVIRARSKRTDAGSPPPSLRPGGRRNNGYSRSQQANGCWVTPSRPPAGWQAKQRLFALAASERMLGHPLPASGRVAGETTVIRARSKRTDAGLPPPASGREAKQRLFALAASERMLGHPLPASARTPPPSGGETRKPSTSAVSRAKPRHQVALSGSKRRPRPGGSE